MPDYKNDILSFLHEDLYHFRDIKPVVESYLKDKNETERNKIINVVQNLCSQLAEKKLINRHPGANANFTALNFGNNQNLPIEMQITIQGEEEYQKFLSAHSNNKTHLIFTGPVGVVNTQTGSHNTITGQSDKKDQQKGPIYWITENKLISAIISGIILMIIAWAIQKITNSKTEITPTHIDSSSKKSDTLGGLNVLILPLKNISGPAKDYASLLRDKLEELNRKDNMGLNVKYLQTHIRSDYFSAAQQDEILNNENANLLIWGSYAVHEGKDLISLQYTTRNTSKITNLNAELKPTSLQEFSKHELSGSIEYLSYFLSAIINFQNYFTFLYDTKSTIGFSDPNQFLRNTTRLINHNIVNSKQSSIDGSYLINGLSYAFMDSFAQGIKFLQLHTKFVDRKSLQGLISLAGLHLEVGNYIAAESAINKALSIDPNNKISLIQKAAILNYLDKPQMAIELAEKCMQIDNLIPQASTVMSLAYKRIYPDCRVPGCDSIIKYSTLSLNYNPNNSELCEDRALSYMERKKFDLAILDLNRTISLMPTRQKYLYRGLCYMALKNLDSAVKDVITAINLGDTSKVTRDLLDKLSQARIR